MPQGHWSSSPVLWPNCRRRRARGAVVTMCAMEKKKRGWSVAFKSRTEGFRSVGDVFVCWRKQNPWNQGAASGSQHVLCGHCVAFVRQCSSRQHDSGPLSRSAQRLRPTPTDSQQWQPYLIHESAGELPPFMCRACYRAHVRAMQREAEATQQRRDRSADRQRRSRSRRKEEAAAKAERAKLAASIAVKRDLKAKNDAETLRGQLRALRKKSTTLRARITELRKASVCVGFLLLVCVVVRRRRPR